MNGTADKDENEAFFRIFFRTSSVGAGAGRMKVFLHRKSAECGKDCTPVVFSRQRHMADCSRVKRIRRLHEGAFHEKVKA